MNCDELATALERTLLRQRNTQWLREAYCHAEHCPSCAQLLELHQVEQHLTELSTVEPCGAFLDAVMNRITLLEPVAIVSSQGSSYGMFRYPAMFLGAAMLAVAYIFPPADQSWLSNLWPSVDFVRNVGISAYLTQHPLWAELLAGIAALLIILGLTTPERQISRPSDTAL